MSEIKTTCFDFVEIAHARQILNKFGLYSLNRDFRGVCGLQTMRLNVTFTPFVTFKLRKLFVHLRKNTYPPTYMCLKPLSTGHLWIGTCLFNRYLTPT